MKKQIKDSKSAIRERIRILKSEGYRGFRISNEKGKLDDVIEVGARSRTGVMLIAIGDTFDEAYENLIERIDKTLDR